MPQSRRCIQSSLFFCLSFGIAVSAVARNGDSGGGPSGTGCCSECGCGENSGTAGDEETEELAEGDGDSDPLDTLDGSFPAEIEETIIAKSGVALGSTVKRPFAMNGVRTASGNASRAVADLAVFGAVTENGLVWMRYNNSRPVSRSRWFGRGANWAHGFQYELSRTGDRTKVAFPEGGVREFLWNGAAWMAEAPDTAEHLFTEGADLILQRPDGIRYRFAESSSGSYRLIAIVDTRQNVTGLEYDDLNRLVRVSEPAGRFLKIVYTRLAGYVVIERVETGDRVKTDYLIRSALYRYTVQAGVPVLSSVAYGDGTAASYDYVLSTSGAAPWLNHARDPRLLGAAVDISYGYDTAPGKPAGIVKSLRNGGGGPVLFAIAAPAGKRTVSYANGGTVEFTVPTAQEGLVSATVDALRRDESFEYGSDGRGFLTASVDPLGRRTVYEKSPYDHPVVITHAAGTTEEAVERWTRDSLDLVLSHTDGAGNTTHYTRDASHRITRINYPDDTFEEFTYNDFGQVLTHRHRNGSISDFRYDERGLLKEVVNAIGDRTHFEYDKADRLRRIEDARRHSTEYDYNDRGQITRITYPLTPPDTAPAFVSYGYDDFGNRTLVTDELGHQWQTTYDNFRRKTETIDPLRRKVEWQYRLPGVAGDGTYMQNKPSAIILPSGRTTTFTWDVEWQLKTRTEGAGTPDAATTAYEYDKAGNLTFVIDPRGHRWSYAYDARNRRISATDPLGHATSWQYDKAGNKTQEIRPDGGLTTYDDYDPLNRLEQVTDPTRTQVTKLAYDSEGNLSRLTDAKGHVYWFEYDALNRRTALVYPNGAREAYAYDPVGNLKTYTTRAGQTRTYSYDERDRETLSDWSDELMPDVTETYDAASRLLTAVSRVSALSYSYDAANQLASETQAIAGASSVKTIRYGYNQDGLPEALTYPDGTVVSKDYTGRNQLASIVSAGPMPLASYTYDLNGNRTAKQLDNGTGVAYAYDVANRMRTLDQQRAGISFSRLDYTYDEMDRRTSMQRDLGKGDSYGYDAIDQLTRVLYNTDNPDTAPANADRTVDYQYDPVGNRVRVTDNGNPTDYVTNRLNQYHTVGLDSVRNSTNGNIFAYKDWRYSYDAQNRFRSALGPTGRYICAYDPFNRCVARRVNGIWSYLYYDGWNLIDERDRGDRQLSEYIHGAEVDEILTRTTRTGAIHYFHHDALGNVTQLTEAGGDVVEQYRYDVYGAPTVMDASGSVLMAGSALGNRFLFTGREYIQEIGLYDYRNRVYSPRLGRFLQVDPLRFGAEDVNMYRYVFNTPNNARDAYGLQSINLKPADSHSQKGNLGKHTSGHASPLGPNTAQIAEAKAAAARKNAEKCMIEAADAADAKSQNKADAAATRADQAAKDAALAASEAHSDRANRDAVAAKVFAAEARGFAGTPPKQN